MKIFPTETERNLAEMSKSVAGIIQVTGGHFLECSKVKTMGRRNVRVSRRRRIIYIIDR